MSGFMYHMAGAEGQESITVVVPGHGPLTRVSSQPNFDEIVRRARAGDESVVNLFDSGKAVAERFKDLSERVSVSNGRLYFDRDEVDHSLAKHVLRLYESGEDFKPWLLFMEKLEQNPQEESKKMLFDFVQAGDLTLTPTGDLVAYKGVQEIDGVFHSLNRGVAYVDPQNGDDMVRVEGTIPYKIGTVVEMPRSEVMFDPNNACAAGLHVAIWSFAVAYGRSGKILEVHVHPRDVVSVPNDARGEKVRVSRLYVAGTKDKPYSAPIADSGVEWWDEDEDSEQPYWEGDNEEDWSSDTEETPQVRTRRKRGILNRIFRSGS
jgi:hypothetical protein